MKYTIEMFVISVSFAFVTSSDFVIDCTRGHDDIRSSKRFVDITLTRHDKWQDIH